MTQTVDERIAALGEQIKQRQHLRAKIAIFQEMYGEIERELERVVAWHHEFTHPIRCELLLSGSGDSVERFNQNTRDRDAADAHLAEAHQTALDQKRHIEKEIERLQNAIDELDD